jgi:hypothetical protein
MLVSLVDFYRARIAERMQIRAQTQPCTIVTSREQCDRVAKVFANSVSYSEKRLKTASSRFVANPDMTQLIIHGPARLSDYEAGMKMMEQIDADIGGFKLQPTPFQMRVINMWRMLIAPVIFRSAYRTHYVELAQIYGWDRSHFGVAIVTSSRKDGKSTAFAYLVCLLLLNFPGETYNIFSGTLSQSIIILNFAKAALASHPRASQFKVNMSERAIKVHAADGDCRTAIAHSGSLEVIYIYFFLFLCVKAAAFLLLLFFIEQICNGRRLARIACDLHRGGAKMFHGGDMRAGLLQRQLHAETDVGLHLGVKLEFDLNRVAGLYFWQRKFAHHRYVLGDYFFLCRAVH